MKIQAQLTPAAGKQMADFRPMVVEEEKHVWAAYKAGTIRELYFQPEPLVVTLVFEAATVADVEATLATFPMVVAGLLDRRIVTLGPWVQWDVLFDPAHRA